MATAQPDMNWYIEISSAKNLSPRCPFASVHRCPNYYASLALLGDAGVSTPINPDEKCLLQETWKKSDLWATTDEQAASIFSREGEPRGFYNFCPEVLFERFGWFASNLSRYSDEIDAGQAERRLASEGAASRDWRWIWAHVTPLHYTECRLYSPLLIGIGEAKRTFSIGFKP